MKEKARAAKTKQKYTLYVRQWFVNATSTLPPLLAASFQIAQNGYIQLVYIQIPDAPCHALRPQSFGMEKFSLKCLGARSRGLFMERKQSRRRRGA